MIPSNFGNLSFIPSFLMSISHKQREKGKWPGIKKTGTCIHTNSATTKKCRLDYRERFQATKRCCWKYCIFYHRNKPINAIAEARRDKDKWWSGGNNVLLVLFVFWQFPEFAWPSIKSAVYGTATYEKKINVLCDGLGFLAKCYWEFVQTRSRACNPKH